MDPDVKLRKFAVFASMQQLWHFEYIIMYPCPCILSDYELPQCPVDEAQCYRELALGLINRALKKIIARKDERTRVYNVFMAPQLLPRCETQSPMHIKNLHWEQSFEEDHSPNG